MASTNQLSTSGGFGELPSGDVIGGIVLAILGLLHLFVLGVGGTLGVVLLLIVWPLLAGAAAAAIEQQQRPTRLKEFGLVGAVAGVFGMVATILVILLVALAGVWSSFVATTFGADLAPVVFGMGILLAITWTIFGFIGGSAVRFAIQNS